VAYIASKMLFDIQDLNEHEDSSLCKNIM